MSRTPRARRLTVLLALALALAFCWFGPVVGANQDNSINFTEIRQQALFAVAAYRSEAENRKQFEGSPAFYLDCATYFFREASAADGLRV